MYNIDIVVSFLVIFSFYYVTESVNTYVKYSLLIEFIHFKCLPVQFAHMCLYGRLLGCSTIVSSTILLI